MNINIIRFKGFIEIQKLSIYIILETGKVFKKDVPDFYHSNPFLSNSTVSSIPKKISYMMF